MALITTIHQVKQVLKISNLNTKDAMPDFDAAEETYIIPAIGQDLYDELKAAYDANTLSTVQAKLLLKVQKPLAAFAYYDDLALQHAVITDTGVRKVQSENMPTAYRWEFDGVKDALAQKAHQGLESLMQFLEDNAVSFPLWTSSDAYVKRNQYLIKTAQDFSSQYRIDQPYRTFSSLLGVMDDVEALYIKPTIGEAFFAELKAETSPTDDEKAVIADLKKAIAHLTIHHAFEKRTVKVTEKGVVIYDRNTDRGASENAQPTADLMSHTMAATKRDGNNYLSKARNYLNANASGSVFATYFQSDKYVAPVEREDPNKDRKMFAF